MADPIETAGIITAVATGVGSLAMSSWQWLAKRNIEHLDDTLKTMSAAISGVQRELKDSLAELGREVWKLRETDIGQAKDIGALQEGQRALERRLEGQAAFYREQTEKLVERLALVRKAGK